MCGVQMGAPVIHDIECIERVVRYVMATLSRGRGRFGYVMRWAAVTCMLCLSRIGLAEAVLQSGVRQN